MRYRLLLVAMLLILSFATGALGQPAPTSKLVPHAGDRVKIRTSPETAELVGSIVAVNDSAFVVSDQDVGQVTVSRQDITGMDIGVKRGSRGKHALVGAAIGGGLGALFGASQGGGDSSSVVTYTTAETALFGFVLFGAAGALVGAVIPTEKWEKVPVEHLRVSEIGREIDIAVSFSF